MINIKGFMKNYYDMAKPKVHTTTVGRKIFAFHTADKRF